MVKMGDAQAGRPASPEERKRAVSQEIPNRQNKQFTNVLPCRSIGRRVGHMTPENKELVTHSGRDPGGGQADRSIHRFLVLAPAAGS